MGRKIDTFLDSKFIDFLFRKYKVIISVLVSLSCLGILYLILSLFVFEDNIDSMIIRPDTENFVLQKSDFAKLKEKSYYKDIVSKKNIFKGAPRRKQKPLQEEISYEFIDNLRLKGIMKGAFKKAVIEDISTGKTYLVGEGEGFKGVTVRDIGNDGVKLDYKGKKFTLKL